MKSLWRLAGPYWSAEEKWSARALLALIVALNLGQVYLAVLFNEWYQLFYNALEQKNMAAFWTQIGRFSWLAVANIVVAVYRIYLQQALEMRWRRWLNQQYLTAWLGERVYYRMELQRRLTDNPDQRISEDLKLFTAGTLDLTLGLLNALVTLFSFVTILWGISGPLSFDFDGRQWTIPGYMVFAAVLYALAGSWLAHRIGRPLVGLNFQQQRYEADYRFSLVRLRENAEGVALYRGEDTEQQGLLQRFGGILGNWWALIKANKRLTWFTAGYTQIALIFPFVVAAPRYFSGAITLGTLMQIGNTFDKVRESLSWFVDSYGAIAAWKASVDRLLDFRAAIDAAAAAQRRHDGMRIEDTDSPDLELRDLELALPDGRVIVRAKESKITSGERVLLTGASGSGKSTVFRAVAGIWPFGRGTVARPGGKRVLFLPQKPYLPITSLRGAVAYPADAGAFGEARVREALRLCGLEKFLPRLDEEAHWGQQLSPGEQQRLAFARALLHEPDWLYLDEATSAVDEAGEQALYALLRERLPHTTVVSIAHRPTVAKYHDARLTLVPADDGMQLVRAT